ncbi:hypothetical protein NXS19_011796 [Fusarium pseudograminearum]|nr:hypothetical protein NXS19_011796 [Fusarium pseudograminearum]
MRSLRGQTAVLYYGQGRFTFYPSSWKQALQLTAIAFILLRYQKTLALYSEYWSTSFETCRDTTVQAQQWPFVLIHCVISNGGTGQRCILHS